MLSIHWGCFKGLCVFYLIEGIFVIFRSILEFHFALPTFREPTGDIWNFFFTKLHVV